MTSDQFVREIERLMARKRVRPATPEYLAEIDAKIDRLRSEWAAQSEPKGLEAIVANLAAEPFRLEIDREGLAKGEILSISYAIEDVQYGISRVKNHPEIPSGE